MDLTHQPPGSLNHIQSVTDSAIKVAGETYATAVILSADTLISDWPVHTASDIQAEHLEMLLKMEPEVVLIGTGKKQIFLNPELLMTLYRQGSGVEMMTTQAACRTFNVLISDNRKVVAALLPPGA
jgi:uncharacterized protein